MKRAFILLTALACAPTQRNVRLVSPDTMSPARGYSHVAVVSGGRTIYVSGQVPVDKDGHLVGGDDLGAQSRQVFENMKAALAAADATMADVVKVTVFLKDASQVDKFRAVRNEYFKSDWPTSSAVEVRALLRPEWLLEVDAIAIAK